MIECLEKEYMPSIFVPKGNVFAGSRLNLKDCLRAARHIRDAVANKYILNLIELTSRKRGRSSPPPTPTQAKKTPVANKYKV